MPTLDDMLPKLAKSTVFSSLDAGSGFWQVPLQEYSVNTRTDDELQCVLGYIRNGWPGHLKSIAVQARAYFRERGSLSEANGLLRRGRQIIIPKSMRTDMLKKVHQGHQVLCGGWASQAM